MKIDFVITWVDGRDPEWLKEKNKFVPVAQDDAQRFEDWDLLKYWFRGVEKFAPWVNKVHFITWRHLPPFLDVSHPKLNIVKHVDYLDEAYLPTFNSNAIELSMHKIENLSEHFVYFNDDMYLLKPVVKSDFFENDLPKDVAILNPIIARSDNSIANVMLNNMGIINKHFSLRKTIKHDRWKWFNFKYKQLNLLNLMFQPWSAAVGLYQQHLPSSFRKSTFEELWAKEPNAFEETSLRKLRDNKLDINQWLIKEWEVMKGDFSPRDINFRKYIMIKNQDDIKKFEKVLRNDKVKLACINDHILEDGEVIQDKMNELFNDLLPEKSSFEK